MTLQTVTLGSVTLACKVAVADLSRFIPGGDGTGKLRPWFAQLLLVTASDRPLCGFLSNGRCRARTSDLLLVRQALSQLS
jgi:hypothetical protein